MMPGAYVSSRVMGCSPPSRVRRRWADDHRGAAAAVPTTGSWVAGARTVGFLPRLWLRGASGGLTTTLAITGATGAITEHTMAGSGPSSSPRGSTLTLIATSGTSVDGTVDEDVDADVDDDDDDALDLAARNSDVM